MRLWNERRIFLTLTRDIPLFVIHFAVIEIKDYKQPEMRARIIERGIPRKIEEGRLENVMKIKDVGIKLIASILSLSLSCLVCNSSRERSWEKGFTQIELNFVVEKKEKSQWWDCEMYPLVVLIFVVFSSLSVSFPCRTCMCLKWQKKKKEEEGKKDFSFFFLPLVYRIKKERPGSGVAFNARRRWWRLKKEIEQHHGSWRERRSRTF